MPMQTKSSPCPCRNRNGLNRRGRVEAFPGQAGMIVAVTIMTCFVDDAGEIKAEEARELRIEETDRVGGRSLCRMGKESEAAGGTIEGGEGQGERGVVSLAKRVSGERIPLIPSLSPPPQPPLPPPPPPPLTVMLAEGGGRGPGEEGASCESSEALPTLENYPVLSPQASPCASPILLVLVH
eukprot:760835-Hanusia_phi.AAC.2